MRRYLLAYVACLAVVLNGCSLTVTPVGLGAGPAQAAAAALPGPLAGALPGSGFGAPAPAPAGLANGPAAPASTGSSSMGLAIRRAAETLPIPFPYAPGTENGNLGCADVVSNALERAGAIRKSEHQLAVKGVIGLLQGKGWRQAGQPYADGDVICWDPLPGGKHMHIGIIVMENGTPYAIHNSSSKRRPVKVPLSSMGRSVDRVLRAPGGVA